MQEMERFFLEGARQMIEVAKDIYARKKTFKVLFPTSKFMETIDWKDIKLKEDEYILKAFPTSSLPDDPAGKLQTIQEYMQAGLVSPRAGRRLPPVDQRLDGHCAGAGRARPVVSRPARL